MISVNITKNKVGNWFEWEESDNELENELLGEFVGIEIEMCGSRLQIDRALRDSMQRNLSNYFPLGDFQWIWRRSHLICFLSVENSRIITGVRLQRIAENRCEHRSRARADSDDARTNSLSTSVSWSLRVDLLFLRVFFDLLRLLFIWIGEFMQRIGDFLNGFGGGFFGGPMMGGGPPAPPPRAMHRECSFSSLQVVFQVTFLFFEIEEFEFDSQLTFFWILFSHASFEGVSGCVPRKGFVGRWQECVIDLHHVAINSIDSQPSPKLSCCSNNFYSVILHSSVLDGLSTWFSVRIEISFLVPTRIIDSFSIHRAPFFVW